MCLDVKGVVEFKTVSASAQLFKGVTLGCCKVVTYWFMCKVENVTFYCTDESVQSCVPMLRRYPGAFDVERIMVDLGMEIAEIFQ